MDGNERTQVYEAMMDLVEECGHWELAQKTATMAHYIALHGLVPHFEKWCDRNERAHGIEGGDN